MADEENESLAGSLVVKFHNRRPVALEDFAASLRALGQLYEDHAVSNGVSDEGAKLYIRDLRSGSLIAVLQALAEQAHFLYSHSDLIQSAFEHSDTLAGFTSHLNDVVTYFLGVEPAAAKTAPEPPSKREAEQIIKFFEPVAKDSGSALSINITGDVHIGTAIFNYGSTEANAVQNAAKRYLGPDLPTLKNLKDEVLVLYQMKGDSKSKTGDKGIIESISHHPVKLIFANENVKNAILELPANPFRLAFLVDVEVKTADQRPALYKVLNVRDTFDRPSVAES